MRQTVQQTQCRRTEQGPRYPSDVIDLAVFWRLRYKLSLRDLAEMFLTRGFIFSYESVREWETKLAPALAEQVDLALKPFPEKQERIARREI